MISVILNRGLAISLLLIVLVLSIVSVVFAQTSAPQEGGVNVTPLSKVPEVTALKQAGQDAKSYCAAITPLEFQAECCVPAFQYGVEKPICQKAVIEAAGEQATFTPTKKFPDQISQQGYGLQIQVRNKCFSMGKFPTSSECQFRDLIDQSIKNIGEIEKRFNCSSEQSAPDCFDLLNQAEKDYYNGPVKEANTDWEKWRDATLTKAAQKAKERNLLVKPAVKPPELKVEQKEKPPVTDSEKKLQLPPSEVQSPQESTESRPTRFKLITTFFGKITFTLKEFFAKWSPLKARK